MSALDQALLKVEQERRLQEGLPPLELMHATYPVRRSGRQWLWPVVLLTSGLAMGAGWWLGQHPEMWSNQPRETPVSVLPAPVTDSVPAEAEAEATVPAADAAAAVFTRPEWLERGQQAWDNNRFAQASAAWMDSLRQQSPTTQGLLLGQRLGLAPAMKLYLAWSDQVPTVMLQQTQGRYPTWMVLVVPVPGELEAAQRQLQEALGSPVPWGQISHWVGWLEPETKAPAIATAPVRTTPVPAMASPSAVRPEPVVATGQATPMAEVTPPISRLETTAAAPRAPELVKETGTALPSIETDFQKIEQMLTRKQHKDAAAAVERLERDIGKTWRTRYLGGVAAVGMGRWDEAVLSLGSALTENPSHARIALYLAVSYQEQGQHAKAMQVLDEALKRHPDMPELWLNHGHSLQEQGLKEGAARSYRRFVDLSADRTDLMVQRSWVLTWLEREGNTP